MTFLPVNRLIGFVLGAFLFCGCSVILAEEQYKQTETDDVALFTYLGQQPCAPAQQFGGVGESSVPEYSTSEYGDSSVDSRYRSDSQRLLSGGGTSRSFGQSAMGVPNMIGDNTFTFWGNASAVGSDMGSSPTAASTRLNVGENFNANVQNRLYLDYRYFDIGDGNMDRVTVGLEKKFARNASLEFRLPVVAMSMPDYSGNNYSETNLGNISLAYKQVLRRGKNWTHVAGLGLNLPTAPDEFGIKNEAFRLTPYYGVQWHPNSRTFGHGVLQIDTPLNQNSQYGQKLPGETTLRLNGSVGRWFYVNNHSSGLNRIGGILEVHYNVITNKFTRDNLSFGDVDPYIWNIVGGMPMQYGKTMIVPSVALPISDTRYFTCEVALNVQRRF